MAEATRTTMQFTQTGRWGAALFLIGPIAAGVALGVLSGAEIGYGRDAIRPDTVGLFYFGAGLAALGGLAGAVMMLIGREYIHHAEPASGGPARG